MYFNSFVVRERGNCDTASFTGMTEEGVGMTEEE